MVGLWKQQVVKVSVALGYDDDIGTGIEKIKQDMLWMCWHFYKEKSIMTQ